MKIYVISAFSKDGQGGNKAGVVLDQPQLSREEKMAIAEELGYAETAFVTKSEQADFKLEYFTPAEEVPLCGHATIAAFSLLKMKNMLNKDNLSMETKAGILAISVSDDGMVTMEQQKPQFYQQLSRQQLQSCFYNDIGQHTLPIEIVSTGLKDILLPIDSVERLAELQPNFETMALLSKEYDVVGVHAFALAEAELQAVCRNFAPLYGIDEESATGTSNCALASYLYQHHEKNLQYIFEQGYNLGEPSRIIVHLQEEAGEICSVTVGGYGYSVEEKIRA